MTPLTGKVKMPLWLLVVSMLCFSCGANQTPSQAPPPSLIYTLSATGNAPSIDVYYINPGNDCGIANATCTILGATLPWSLNVNYSSCYCSGTYSVDKKSTSYGVTIRIVKNASTTLCTSVSSSGVSNPQTVVCSLNSP